MKWLLSGLFTVELYGLVVLFCVYQSPLPALWMLPFVFVTGAANIVYALRKASFAQQTKDNRIHMLLIKLLAIPYFILNFWFCISVAVVPPLTVPFIGIISLGTIPFTVAGTFS